VFDQYHVVSNRALYRTIHKGRVLQGGIPLPKLKNEKLARRDVVSDLGYQKT